MRNPRTVVLAAAVALTLAIPALADAQSRGRAVPRQPPGPGGGPVAGPVGRPVVGGPGRAVPRPPVAVSGYRPYGPYPNRGGYGRPYYGYGRPYYGYGYPGYGYPYYYRPGVSLGFAYGYPWGPWGVGFGVGFGVGYGYPGWYGGWAGYGGYPFYGGAYPYYGYAVPAYGGVRIDVPQRNAEVMVDGYFVGVVDDFDGSFQQVNLEPGPHRIEVRATGFETVGFDVNVTAGRTVTYRAGLRPTAP